VRRRFDSPIFKGLSVQLNDVKNAEGSVQILSTAIAAKKIWPISLHSMPNVTIHWTGNGTGSFEARTLTNQTSKPYTPHAMTQVDKIRAKGYTGRGIKVAVIDTGVRSLSSPARTTYRKKNPRQACLLQDISCGNKILTVTRLITSIQLLGDALATVAWCPVATILLVTITMVEMIQFLMMTLWIVTAMAHMCLE
jgi:hypothetical protein